MNRIKQVIKIWWPAIAVVLVFASILVVIANAPCNVGISEIWVLQPLESNAVTKGDVFLGTGTDEMGYEFYRFAVAEPGGGYHTMNVSKQEVKLFPQEGRENAWVELKYSNGSECIPPEVAADRGRFHSYWYEAYIPTGATAPLSNLE